MSQLTAIDANMLNVENGTTWTHIAGLGILDPASCPGGRLTVRALIDLVAQRAHLAPRPLRLRLAQVPLGLDHPYWEDDPGFDPSRHIYEIALPAPGDDAQLADAVARLHEQPLDRARPLWEMVLIHGLSGGRAAVYAKVHHAAIDGVLAAETLAVLLDLTPEPRELPPDEGPQEHAPGRGAMFGTGLLRTALYPVNSMRALIRTAPYLDEVPIVGRLPGVDAVSHTLQGALGRRGAPRPTMLGAPATPFNGPVSRHRSVAFGSLPLAEVKHIGRAMEASVNDVVMALCATALRRWLDKRGELPDQPLVTAVPVSLRQPTGGAIDTGKGTDVAIMVTPLAVHLADPAARFDAVRRDLDVAKRRFSVSSGGWLQSLLDLLPASLPGPVLRLALQSARTPLLRAINLVISNVPGPQFPLYLAGARLLSYYPISVIADLTGGLNITVFSYDGRVDVGVVACREMIPDTWEIVDYLDDALQELKELTTPPLE